MPPTDQPERMDNHIIFTYSWPEVQGLLRVVLRQWILSFLLYYVSVPALALLITWLSGPFTFEGGWGFQFGCLLGAVVMALIILLSILNQHRRDHETAWRRMLDKPVELVLDEDGMDFIVPDAKVRYHWRDLKQITEVANFYHLNIVGHDALIIPVRSLSPEQFQFIRSRAGL